MSRAPAFPAVIPKPLAVGPARGAFQLGPRTRFVVTSGDPEVARVARMLAGRLRAATGLRLAVTATLRTPRPGDVAFSLSDDRSLGEEGYRLVVEPDLVTLTARRPAGLFYGTQTLRQLLPARVESETSQPGPWPIPVVTIHDRPRFAWRGVMLDVARHFFGSAEVRRLVDLAALYKLNRLHLHLTDDQGWRLSIRSRPGLTRHGGRTQVGGGVGGYFTQRQYRELVRYADARFVTVVPEIDMPGHTNAALAAYPELTCDGVAPAPYTGIEVGFSSLCIRKAETYAFVDDVVREVAALTPGAYVHIGGDEALATDHDEYLHFLGRVAGIVRRHGKRMIGWEEVAKARLRRTSVVQHWHDPALARRAVEQGAKLVLSPATKAYLDMKYAPDTELGLSWAGTTDVRSAYAWDPATQVDGVTERDVLGVEAALWSETIETRSDLDHLAFPRLLGHAEIAWSPASGRSWRDYRRRLGDHGERLRELGVGFHADTSVPWR